MKLAKWRSIDSDGWPGRRFRWWPIYLTVIDCYGLPPGPIVLALFFCYLIYWAIGYASVMAR